MKQYSLQDSPEVRVFLNVDYSQLEFRLFAELERKRNERKDENLFSATYDLVDSFEGST